MSPLAIAVVFILSCLFLFWFGLHWLAWIVEKNSVPEEGPTRDGILLAWAMENGFDYRRGEYRNFQKAYPLSFLAWEKAVYGADVAGGTMNNQEFLAFEHVYPRREINQDGEYHDMIRTATVVICETGCDLPNVVASPTSSDSESDIDFESVAFNEAFEVMSDDRRVAFDLLQPRVMELLHENHPISVEWSGKYVAVSRGSALPVEEIEQLIAIAGRLVSMVPGYLDRSDGGDCSD